MGCRVFNLGDTKLERFLPKINNLSDHYYFVPLGIETYGAYGPQGIKLVKQIGKKIQDATGEKLSTFYLFQIISMAIQKGNAQCVTGCVKDRSSGLEGLFKFHVQERAVIMNKNNIYLYLISI